MHLKVKRCEIFKGRICTDGRKQRRTKSKEELSSAVVAIESVMVTSAIEAHENQEVATTDIPGAFLHGAVNKRIIVTLRGKIARMMMSVNPKFYQRFVIIERRKKGTVCTLVESTLWHNAGSADILAKARWRPS